MDLSSHVTLQDWEARRATVDLSREPVTGIVWFDTLRSWLARFPLSIIQLAGRVGVGAVFFKAGLLKYNSWDFTVLLFRTSTGTAARSRGRGANRYGPGTDDSDLPVSGLATRLATLPLLGMILVIQTFVYPNVYNDHLVWGSILLLVLTRGPGVFSLDYLIERVIMARRSARGR